MDVHDALESFRKLLSAPLGSNIDIRLIARNSILSTNTRLKLVLSVQISHQLLQLRATLRPCVHNRSQLGSPEIVPNVLACPLAHTVSPDGLVVLVAMDT